MGIFGGVPKIRVPLVIILILDWDFANHPAILGYPLGTMETPHLMGFQGMNEILWNHQIEVISPSPNVHHSDKFMGFLRPCIGADMETDLDLQKGYAPGPWWKRSLPVVIARLFSHPQCRTHLQICCVEMETDIFCASTMHTFKKTVLHAC